MSLRRGDISGLVPLVIFLMKMKIFLIVKFFKLLNLHSRLHVHAKLPAYSTNLSVSLVL